MRNLFGDSERESILQRLDQLQVDSARQWGTMDPAQMMVHCSRALEVATGDRPMKRGLLGRILGPLVRSMVLGEKPFKRNGPTDPAFVVTDPQDFAAERARLRELLDRFCRSGPSAAAKHVHVFFGRLEGDEWGALMYKHLDHHLRQFGV